MIEEFMLQLYGIIIEVIALPFRLISQVIETLDNIWDRIYPKAEDTMYELDETQQQPEYPEPVEVKGFHTLEDKEKGNG